jgi:hypothetical protein
MARAKGVRISFIAFLMILFPGSGRAAITDPGIRKGGGTGLAVDAVGVYIIVFVETGKSRFVERALLP